MDSKTKFLVSVKIILLSTKMQAFFPLCLLLIQKTILDRPSEKNNKLKDKIFGIDLT